MSEQESFDALMTRLRAGDDAAATTVFRRFAHRLIALARVKLESMSQAREEAEDVIQSVYKSFFDRYGRGEFAFDDWDALWGLLTLITLRKCSNRRTYHRAQRRGGARTPVGSAGVTVLPVADREPTPFEAAALADMVHELIRGMDQSDRETVCMLLQGYTAREIADAHSCSERTVGRVRGRLERRLKQLYEA